MEFVIIWALFGFVTAAVASSKGRGGCGWFAVGVLLGPFGLILAFVASKDQKAVEERAVREGEQKKCPFCAELVKCEAVVCKHCGRDLPPEPVPEPGPDLDQLLTDLRATEAELLIRLNSGENVTDALKNIREKIALLERQR